MSPAMEPMSFEDLSELYRVEMKSSSITPVRRDLFRAIANLLTALRQEYDRQMSADPDSVMCEGADQRRKKAERLAKDVVHIRTQKICQMAIRGAMGGRNALDTLTDEEKAYYERVQELSKAHMSEVDRLRGRRVTVDTRIDEVPAARPEPVPEAVPAEPEPAEPIPEMFDDSPEDFADEPIPDEFDVPAEGFDEAPAQAGPAPAEAPAEPEPVAESHDEEGDELEPVLIRILEDLPEFAGPDRDYKLLKEDVVTLPRVLAEVLVNSEKAVGIRPTP